MSTSSTIFTRTFSLLPQATGKARTYEKLMERMLAFRDLQNTYVDVLAVALQNGRLDVSSFSGESKSHMKGAIYNELKLNQIYTSHPAQIQLKERMLRCAIQYPYFVVREWLVRRHYLSVIIQKFKGMITHTPRHAVTFLQGGQLSHAAMKRVSRGLENDVFGNRVALSYHYIQNLVGQARNLFLANSSLESVLSMRMKEILNNSAIIEAFIEVVLRSFTWKQKKKREKLPPSEIISYFSKLYISQVKRKSSWRAKHVEKHPNLKKFKKQRDLSFKPLEVSLMEHLDRLSADFSSNLAREILVKHLEEGLNATTRKRTLTTQVFNPIRRTSPISSTVSLDGFMVYFKQVVKNQVNSKLNELFLTTYVINQVIAEFTYLKATLSTLVPLPKIKRLAVPINQEESVYSPDFNTLTIKLSFLSREWFDLDIKDEKGRIKALFDGGTLPCLPVITLKGHKLLLHLPLERPSSELSEQAPEYVDLPEKQIELGVDLGLKHPAVLSVMDRSDPARPVEIGRYFLSMETLFDMNFTPTSGKFVKKARFSNPHSNKKSNIKYSFRNLRREARQLQRKVHEYKNRYLKWEKKNPKDKYKYYRLQRDLSRVWERVNCMNREVIRQLQHVIIAIAEFHGVTVLKFENLKWSRHSKKDDAGGWLSFWQVHWFFSQVQEAVEFQANLNAIAFQRVRANYTSQDCWECGTRGTRDGRSFTCTNIDHHTSGKSVRIHADLNAARVIALS